LFIAMVADFAIFVYVLISLKVYISRFLDGKDKKFWTLPKLALTFLAILLILRILYFILLPTGVFQTNSSAAGSLITLLADSPTIMFAMIMSLVFYQWASIYHFTMKTKNKKRNKKILRTSLIVANLLFVLAFIAIVIFYAILSSKVGLIITCSNTVNYYVETSRILSLVYKSLYALMCTILTILLIIYSNKLVQLVKKSPIKKTNNKKNKSKKRV